MLIDIRIRRCLNVQYTNIKIAEVGKVLSENMDIVFCIFKGNEYYANLDWTGLYMLSSQEKLMENIDTRSDREWVNGLRMDEIEKFFANIRMQQYCWKSLKNGSKKYGQLIGKRFAPLLIE